MENLRKDMQNILKKNCVTIISWSKSQLGGTQFYNRKRHPPIQFRNNASRFPFYQNNREFRKLLTIMTSWQKNRMNENTPYTHIHQIMSWLQLKSTDIRHMNRFHAQNAANLTLWRPHRDVSKQQSTLKCKSARS